MEREFLGFSSKNSPWTTMKEDASNKPKDQGINFHLFLFSMKYFALTTIVMGM